MRRPIALFATLVIVTLAACSASAAGGSAGSNGAAQRSSTQTVQAGPVTVQATWEDVGGSLSFQVKLDNHEIDLDAVTFAGAALTNDRGDRITATEWAASAGGHHREGSLVFVGSAGPFLAGARWVELTLPAIGPNAVPPLRWTLGASS